VCLTITSAVCPGNQFETGVCNLFLSSLTLPEKVLSAGALAAIIIGALVAAAALVFGGKKSIEYYQLYRGQFRGAASTNPLYTPSGHAGENPLYR